MPIIRGSERDKLYQRVANCVGNTPLYKIHNIAVPNGCQIFCKEEHLNPTGSHYDRFWVDYLRYQEDTSRISTTDTLIETSTGNSGASFAWACRALGFREYHVVIPEDMPFSRIRQIEDLGAVVKTSPAGEYVDGLIRTFQGYCQTVRANPNNRGPVKLPNHSRFGKASLSSLAEIAEESIHALEHEYSVRRLDYFITALGNGLSTQGMGEKLKLKYPHISLVGIEAAQSPTVYAKLHPDEKKPETTGKTHGLLGTSPGIDPTIFPIMDGYSSELTQVELIDEQRWTNAGIQLANQEGKLVGHTSAAAFCMAMEIAKKQKNKNFLIVFYDPAWKYL